MAIGSSCFGLLFLGSGSTFGSTSPLVSAGRFCPLLSVLVLWVAKLTQDASSGPPRYSPDQTKESPRTSVSDCRLRLHGILRQTNTEILAQELRLAKSPTTSPLPTGGFGDGV